MIILHWVIFTSCWRSNRRTVTGRIIHRNPASTPLLFPLCLDLMLHHRGPSHQTPVLHPCMNLVVVQVQGLLHHQVTWSFLRRILGDAPVVLVRPLKSMFWTSGDLCLGLQSQGGSPLQRASSPVCYFDGQNKLHTHSIHPSKCPSQRKVKDATYKNIDVNDSCKRRLAWP